MTRPRTAEAEPIRVGLPDDSLKLTPDPTESAKPKKPLPTGGKLFYLVWTRAARQLELLPSEAQKLQAIQFIVEELGLGPKQNKLPPGASDPRD